MSAAAAISPDLGRQIVDSTPARPVCAFCRVRPAGDERACSDDTDLVCRCCPHCRTFNCREAQNDA